MLRGSPHLAMVDYILRIKVNQLRGLSDEDKTELLLLKGGLQKHTAGLKNKLPVLNLEWHCIHDRHLNVLMQSIKTILK